MPFESDGFSKDPPSSSLSADGIATTLGYADAATLTAAIDAGVPQALDTTDSPQFAGINLGHASDTTLTRTGAGVAAIEGAEITTNSGTQTLSNKTLTAPKLADGGYIADGNGNELLIGDTVASAVNEITVANAATAGNPKISATGGDTNIGLDLQAKGTGTYNLLGSATAPAEQRLYEDTDNGTNYVALKAPASIGTSATWTLPASTGAGKVLTDVNGDNVLTMETPSAGSYAGASLGVASNQAFVSAAEENIEWTEQIIAPTAGLSHSTGTLPDEITCNGTKKRKVTANVGIDPSYGNWAIYTLALYINNVKIKEVSNGGYGTIIDPFYLHLSHSQEIADTHKIEVSIYSSAGAGDVMGKATNCYRATLEIEES